MNKRSIVTMTLVLVLGMGISTASLSWAADQPVDSQVLVGKWGGTWNTPKYRMNAVLRVDSATETEISGHYSHEASMEFESGGWPFTVPLKRCGKKLCFTLKAPGSGKEFTMTLSGDKLEGQSSNSYVVMKKTP